MSLTEQQRAAAHAPGSVAVLAGAGSGKTHMLVARYLHLLEQYSPLEIPAVTFTEAGAAELRARIRTEVSRQRPGDVETLAELEAAQISTIHALCGRIVRDHPEAAGVRPDATVMDEAQARLWLAQHFDAALAHLPLELFRHLPYSQLDATLRVLLSDPILAGQALSVGAEDWETWTREAQAASLARMSADARWQNAVHNLHAYQGAATDRMEQTRLVAVEALAALERGEVGAAFATLREIKVNAGSARQWPGGGFDAVKKALKTVREYADAADGTLLTYQPGEADQWLSAALPDLRQAYFQVRDTLANLKRQAGLLDFNDLEVCALRALSDPAVAAYYAERWKAFLIDEAQDNNPVQAEILGILTAAAQRTVVGDLKQSIYGFRRAAPELFLNTSEAIVKAGGTQVTLNQSFRTHQGLIDISNRLFGILLGEQYSPLEGVRPGPEQPVIGGWQVADVKPKYLARQIEAQRIAAQILEMLSTHPVYDKTTGQMRPMRPGDVAVLTRGWAALEPIRRALGAAGLPVQDIGSGSLLDTQEARDAVALLAALALHDPVALITILRSPFLALPDHVIQASFQEAGETDWFSALLQSETSELGQARHLLTELRVRQRFTRPSELLLLADELTGYSAILANLPDSERRLADWRGTVELIRQLEFTHDDLFSVVLELREYIKSGVSVPRPSLEERDAVTLTTMHSSKGLEWPVVIVADLGWVAPPGSAAVLLDARRGVGLRGSLETLPALYLLLKEEQQAREEAETRRLLYVALTRARDYLTLTSNGNGRGKSLLNTLRPGLEAAGIAVTLVMPEAGEEN